MTKELPPSEDIVEATTDREGVVVRAWNVVRDGLRNFCSEDTSGIRPGYYVHSSAHPVTGGPEQSLDEVYAALAMIDDTYR